MDYTNYTQNIVFMPTNANIVMMHTSEIIYDNFNIQFLSKVMMTTPLPPTIIILCM